MGKMKRIMSVLSCTIFVLATAIPVSAEAETIKRVQGTTTCAGCGATAKFLSYGKPVAYSNSTTNSHDERVELIYSCSKGHKTTLYEWRSNQSHTFKMYDDLGHTGSSSDTHQYWVRCECGNGKNVYVDCNYSKTGVHTRPF